jgi:CSLREA domain-containing protein
MINKNRPLLAASFLPFITLAALILVLTLYRPSQASPNGTFNVNTVADTDDGICNVAHCTLREAVNAANNAAGPDTITFTLPPSATITLAGSQLPTIIDHLTIDGSTAVSLTISGDNITRIFMVGGAPAVTLTTLTIEHGQAITGGAVYNDGGSLTIDNSLLEDNSAEYGGGLYNEAGSLTITNSRIANNFAEYGGGAIFNTENTTTTIHSTIFVGNIADAELNVVVISGGGILNAGMLTISDSTFSNNGAFADANPVLPSPIEGHSAGGAINNSGQLAVYNSTFNNNLVTASSEPFLNTASYGFSTNDSAVGGGIYNSGVMMVSNSTFSGNMAFAADSFQGAVPAIAYAGGGGISNTSMGTMTIVNSTFSENGTFNYPWGAGGGGSLSNSGVLHLSNTIIANSNDSVDCVNNGTMSTNVNSLVEDGTCNSILSGEPLLYPLQDNGGPTWTHALSSFSIAIDVGDNATCAAAPVNNLDQRGVTRPLDGNGDGTSVCDIGAYEYDGPPPEKSFLPILRRE